MATLQSTQVSVAGRVRQDGRPAGSLAFDFAATVLAAWFIIGLFLDGWAHNHGRVDDSFFTPWHAVMYSGVLAVAALLTFTQYRNMSKGYSWLRSLPEGYGWSLAGVTLFFVGGGFDFVWHTLFGFEANIEALLSPAHLFLLTGAFLFTTGMLRAGWKRAERSTGFVNLLPVVLGFTMLLSLLTFFTMFSNPYVHARVLTTKFRPNGDVRELMEIISIIGILLHAVFISGVVQIMLRRWKLPFGTFTLMFTLNAALMLWVQWKRAIDTAPVLLAAPLAGLVTDILIARLKPSISRPGPFRLVAGALPLAHYLVYFGILNTTYGTWWRIHMWLGVTVMAGMVGVLISYLVVPFAAPQENA